MGCIKSELPAAGCSGNRVLKLFYANRVLLVEHAVVFIIIFDG